MNITITEGKSRTATLVFKNAAGEIIPPPDGYELAGMVQYWDGGNIQSTSNPTSLTIKCTGTKIGADYLPPRGAQIKAFVVLPGGAQLTAVSNVGLISPTSSCQVDMVPASVELVWGSET